MIKTGIFLMKEKDTFILIWGSYLYFFVDLYRRNWFRQQYWG